MPHPGPTPLPAGCRAGAAPPPMTQPSALWPDDARRLAFEAWLDWIAPAQGLRPGTVRPASADASFRRYFRVDTVGGGSRIIMDAPPDREDCTPFVALARRLRDGGLRAPEVLDWDAAQGFMLLEDLGGRTFLDAVRGRSPEEAAPCYRSALAALVTLQSIPAATAVPAYDRARLRAELELFRPWYVERHAGFALDTAGAESLEACFRLILDACEAQPRVLVHRDFHSRNLMVAAGHEDQPPGVLDFQDAVWGPITYDLVSLLRDAYVDWDEEVQLDWAIRGWERARRARLPVAEDFGDFWRDFEWMGLQRHLKVLGIFARLQHRDGKGAYLADLPRVWTYAHRVATRYQGLGPLAHLLEAVAGVDRLDAATF